MKGERPSGRDEDAVMEALTSRGIAQRAEGGQGFGRLFTVLLFALFIVALLTWSHISVNTVLLAIYPIVMLFAFSLGVGLILSTMYVFVRDIMHIWEVFCTLLVYGSAIFYDPRQMESWMQYVINLNPIYWYITSVRSCVMWGEGLTPNMVLIPFLCAALSLGLGVYVFKKNQDKFVLYM